MINGPMEGADEEEFSTLVEHGEKLFAAGNFRDACRFFEQLLRTHPASAVVRNNLGVAYWQQGRVADALTHLVSAVEADKDYRESYVNLANILLVLKRGTEAGAIIDAYLSRYPEDIELKRLRVACVGPAPVLEVGERTEASDLGAPIFSAEDLQQEQEETLRVAIFSTEPEEWACAQLRLVSPLNASTDKIELLWAGNREDQSIRFDLSVIERSDVLVVQRFFPTHETRELCRNIVQSGKPVIYEIDDNFLDVPLTHPRRDIIAASVPYVLELMSHAECVTVTTDRLAERLARYCGAISVLPNFLPGEIWSRDSDICAGNKDADVVTIGYSGTETHWEDLDLIETVLNRIRAKYGERVVLKFFGCAPRGLSCGTGVEIEGFTLDYSDYADALRESGIDIAIAPLVDNAFNACKSDIKWLEYSACGFAGVYSDVPAYRDSVRHGHTGLLVENSEEAWFRALDSLISNPDLRIRLGCTAKAQVLATRTLESFREKILLTYRRVGVAGKCADRNAALSADYEIWKQNHQLTGGARMLWKRRAQRLADTLRFDLVVDGIGRTVEALDVTLDSIAKQIHGGASVTVISGVSSRRKFYGIEIQWIDPSDERLGSIKTVLGGLSGDWFGLVRAGDSLAEEALAVCAAYIGLHTDWNALYTDEDTGTVGDVRYSPLFKPQMNLDLLRSVPYVGNLCLVRRRAALSVGGRCRAGSVGNADLILRLVERYGEKGIGHIPWVLYHRGASDAVRGPASAAGDAYRTVVRHHLSRQGIPATVAEGVTDAACDVRYHRTEQPLVSIIIPTKDKTDVLSDCIESILHKTSYPNYELIVVDNGSHEPRTLALLERLECEHKTLRVVSFPGEFNFAAINNEAANLARGSYLLLLNNDTVVLQTDWLERMLEHGLRPDVGVVGARLLFINGSVQHGGVVLGMGGVAGAIGRGSGLGSPGYMYRGQLDQNYSAVSGACMLVRKDLYLSVGGMDAGQFKSRFGDVDLCLKIGDAGYRVVWTPRVSLIHHESVSLGDALKARRTDLPDSQSEGLLGRWLPQLSRDRSYNRNLSLAHGDWVLETEVDVPWDTEFSDSPRILGFGAGSEGVLAHRMRAPLEVLAEVGVAQCGMVSVRGGRSRVPTVCELARAAPDTVLAHNAIHEDQLQALQAYRRFTDSFLVFGQDDLMFDLPRSNPFYHTVFKDIRRRLREALSTCHRLIVSTEPLMDAYRTYADDIVVVPNYLRRSIWGDLQSRRRRGTKPRVGWAGAQQHGGDLRILREVIKATADEVEWVFFGMTLREFNQYRVEFHDAVSMETYPQALARMDLDLAVAPLEFNRFNECKSNLRLLEYGAMGWPVVCTDIAPYRTAPVCRVSNKPDAWIAAIRERIHDLDAAGREGDRLRQWVRDQWFLEDHLKDWLSALSSDPNKGWQVCEVREGNSVTAQAAHTRHIR